MLIHHRLSQGYTKNLSDIIVIWLIDIRFELKKFISYGLRKPFDSIMMSRFL